MNWRGEVRTRIRCEVASFRQTNVSPTVSIVTDGPSKRTLIEHPLTEHRRGGGIVRIGRTKRLDFCEHHLFISTSVELWRFFKRSACGPRGRDESHRRGHAQTAYGARRTKSQLELTPAGRRTTEYLAGVFVVRVHHETFGQRQLAFVRVEADERRFAAVIHFHEPGGSSTHGTRRNTHVSRRRTKRNGERDTAETIVTTEKKKNSVTRPVWAYGNGIFYCAAYRQKRNTCVV